MPHCALTNGFLLLFLCLTACGQQKKKDENRKSGPQGPGTIRVPEGPSPQDFAPIPVSETDPMAQIAAAGKLTLATGLRNWSPACLLEAWSRHFSFRSSLNAQSIENPDTLIVFPLFKGSYSERYLRLMLLELRQEIPLLDELGFNGNVETLGPDGVRALRCLKPDGSLDLELCSRIWNPAGRNAAQGQTVAQRAEAGTLRDFLLDALNSEKACAAPGSEYAPNFQCPKDYSRAIFSYKKSATGDRLAEAASFRFLGLSGTQGGNVANLPLRDLKAPEIRFGEIPLTPESDETTSPTSLADSFSLESDAVDQLTAMNGLVRLLKNAHRNYDPEKNRILRGSIQFSWNSGSFGVNGFSPVFEGSALGNSIVMLNGIGDWTDIMSPQKICSQDSHEREVLAIEFSGVQGAGLTYRSEGSGGTVRRLTSDVRLSTDCRVQQVPPPENPTLEEKLGVNFEWKASEPDPAQYEWRFSWGMHSAPAQIVGEIPEGPWNVTLGTKMLGAIDFGAATPLRNGHPTIFIPRINVETNSEGVITAIRVRFSWFDSINGTWKEVDTPSAMEKIQPVSSTGASLELVGQGVVEGWSKLVSTHPLELCLGTRVDSTVECVTDAKGWRIRTSANANNSSIPRLEKILLGNWSFGNQHVAIFPAP